MEKKCLNKGCIDSKNLRMRMEKFKKKKKYIKE